MSPSEYQSKPNRIRFALMAAFAAPLVLSACASSAPLGDHRGVRAVPQEQARIGFDLPTFQGEKVRRIKYEDPNQREEYALFRGNGARAEVIYASLQGRSRDLGFIDYRTAMKDQVRTWNFNRNHTEFQGQARYVEKDKKMIVRRFKNTATSQECFGFTREGQRNFFLPRAPFAEMMFGYYCGPKGKTMTDAEVDTYARSVAFKKASFKYPENAAGTAGLYHIPEALQLAKTGDVNAGGAPTAGEAPVVLTPEQQKELELLLELPAGTLGREQQVQGKTFDGAPGTGVDVEELFGNENFPFILGRFFSPRAFGFRGFMGGPTRRDPSTFFGGGS